MLKVVVVDNSAISRNLLASILVNGGHDVIGDVNTSPASIARLIKMSPQVVCIDVGGPDGNGLALIDTLRESLPKVLLFLVSGNLDPAMVQAGIGHGVHGFIVKPFNAVTVLTTIRNTIIKLARQHKQESGAQPHVSSS